MAHGGTPAVDPSLILKSRYRLGAALGALIGAVVLQFLPVLAQVENLLYDWRVRWAAERFAPRDDIVLVEIDEESLHRMPTDGHQWPWPRIWIAALIDYCRLARSIGIDILYAENQWHWHGTEGDRILSRKIADAGNVVLAAHFFEQWEGEASTDSMERWAIAGDPAVLAGWADLRGVSLPIPSLREATRGLGHVSADLDLDGVFRRYLACVRDRDAAIPSLALVMAREGLGLRSDEVAVESGGRLRLGSRRFQLRPDGSFNLVPQPGRYPTVSAADIIAAWQKEPEGTPPVVSRDFFRDKLVLIGLTAPLVKDYQKTSIAKSVPGLWLHAAATQNLLEGTHFRVLPSWAGWGLMALLALAPALPRLERPRAMAAAGLGLTAIYLASAGGALAGSLLMLPLIGPLLACALSCSLLAASYWGHERNRRQCMEAMEFAKQQFTDMLVHDLKNTVAPIMMSLSMRDLAGPDGEPAPSDGEFWRTDFPEIVWTSSNKLMSQINALLDIRRMQEGKLELHPTPCRPAELLDRLEHEYHIPAKRSDLSLAMRNEAPVGACVCVDPNVFDRIMGNLIWNAVKYAREQSTVRIGVRPASPGRLEFYVSNEGRAIDPEIKALLFTAFSTGSDSVASIAMPSTGLGLAFCKLAVEAHGGHIELLSPRVDEPDGVEVRVRLKMVSEEEAAGEGGGAR